MNKFLSKIIILLFRFKQYTLIEKCVDYCIRNRIRPFNPFELDYNLKVDMENMITDILQSDDDRLFKLLLRLNSKSVKKFLKLKNFIIDILCNSHSHKILKRCILINQNYDYDLLMDYCEYNGLYDHLYDLEFLHGKR